MLVDPTRRMSLLCALHPTDIVFVGLPAVGTRYVGLLGLHSLVEYVFFVQHYLSPSARNVLNVKMPVLCPSENTKLIAYLPTSDIDPNEISSDTLSSLNIFSPVHSLTQLAHGQALRSTADISVSSLPSDQTILTVESFSSIICLGSNMFFSWSRP